MTGDSDSEAESRSDRAWSNTGLPTDHPASQYCLAVIRHANRPDECTICPRSVRPAEAYDTWITADRDAVVDLEANR